jgi:hypothetical protein
MNWFSSLWQKNNKNKRDTSTDYNHEPTPIMITPQQLYSDYQENEIAADIKYKGRIIRLKGVVGVIGREPRDGGVDEAFVTLTKVTYGELPNGKRVKTMMLRTAVCCFFNTRCEPQLAQVRKGQKITVQGRCEEKHPLSYVCMGDCILVG